MCNDCQYIHERRRLRELVYAEGQPLNRYDEALIESMMEMLKLRNTPSSDQRAA